VGTEAACELTLVMAIGPEKVIANPASSLGTKLRVSGVTMLVTASVVCPSKVISAAAAYVKP